MNGVLSRFPLELRYVAYVPACTGLFVLWDGDRPVAVAAAPNVLDAVRQHYHGEREPAPPAVTHFSYEPASRPGEQVQFLAQALERQGFQRPGVIGN